MPRLSLQSYDEKKAALASQLAKLDNVDLPAVLMKAVNRAKSNIQAKLDGLAVTQTRTKQINENKEGLTKQLLINAKNCITGQNGWVITAHEGFGSVAIERNNVRITNRIANPETTIQLTATEDQLKKIAQFLSTIFSASAPPQAAKVAPKLAVKTTG